MADLFFTRISILAPESGSISHPNSRSSEAQFFLRGLLLPLPSAKKTCERVFGVSTHVSKNETWGTRLPGPPAHLYSLCPEIAVELLRFLAVLQSQLLQFPCFGIHKSNLLETRMVVTTYNDHVRLLSPGPWLVGTTKVYPGVGADIVMESITPTTLPSRLRGVNECKRLIYKRGCQEHSCPSTGSGESFLDFQPLAAMRGGSVLPFGLLLRQVLCCCSQFHLRLVATTRWVSETGKRGGVADVATKDLSEARGLVLFRVV